MNANELADKLLAASNDMEHNFHVSDWKLLFECALVMLNQQAKLECYERLADASKMASNPMSIKSRVMLKNVGEMKTIMTKEALAQPEQEPVAWMNDSTPSGIFARHMEGAKNFGCTIPLYTAPPQRKG